MTGYKFTVVGDTNTILHLWFSSNLCILIHHCP